MPTISHLLDTSALLAHYFGEPGSDEVDALWQDSDSRIAICVLSIPELRTRLQVELQDEVEAERAIGLYADELTIGLPVDRAVAIEASRLRNAGAARLPLVDACIAGCASIHQATLVHRDPHMDVLPKSEVQQLRLPDR